MAEGIRCRLARYLEHLTEEELKKFKLYLKDERSIPRGRVEGADRAELAELLVSALGERDVWELTGSIWEEMGLRGLWERAGEEGPRDPTEGLRLKTNPRNTKKHQEGKVW
ncbi:NACHT, LRR and PYD domains-containing protein 3-like isoform X2 [Sminthopsis crassicaudata]|uniref:NACHT, LRR and PYD domains-containing protein 3-like isoform X2 n=1 Tax=Sminthopsis crassicaudata TaxID=9301 RepID=UPI003D69312B